MHASVCVCERVCVRVGGIGIGSADAQTINNEHQATPSTQHPAQPPQSTRARSHTRTTKKVIHLQATRAPRTYTHTRTHSTTHSNSTPPRFTCTRTHKHTHTQHIHSTVDSKPHCDDTHATQTHATHTHTTHTHNTNTTHTPTLTPTPRTPTGVVLTSNSTVTLNNTSILGSCVVTLVEPLWSVSITSNTTSGVYHGGCVVYALCILLCMWCVCVLCIVFCVLCVVCLLCVVCCFLCVVSCVCLVSVCG